MKSEPHVKKHYRRRVCLSAFAIMSAVMMLAMVLTPGVTTTVSASVTESTGDASLSQITLVGLTNDNGEPVTWVKSGQNFNEIHNIYQGAQITAIEITYFTLTASQNQVSYQLKQGDNVVSELTRGHASWVQSSPAQYTQMMTYTLPTPLVLTDAGDYSLEVKLWEYQ